MGLVSPHVLYVTSAGQPCTSQGAAPRRRPCGAPAHPRSPALTASACPAPRRTTALPTARGLTRMPGGGWRL